MKHLELWRERFAAEPVGLTDAELVRVRSIFGEVRG